MQSLTLKEKYILNLTALLVTDLCIYSINLFIANVLVFVLYIKYFLISVFFSLNIFIESYYIFSQVLFCETKETYPTLQRISCPFSSQIGFTCTCCNVNEVLLQMNDQNFMHYFTLSYTSVFPSRCWKSWFSYLLVAHALFPHLSHIFKVQPFCSKEADKCFSA